MKFAVIQTGGKQYIVKPGDTIKIEKLSSTPEKKIEVGSTVSFDEILLINDADNTILGNPFMEGVSISGVVTEKGRGRKVITQKYKAKVRYRNKKGHRQPFMKVKIDNIN